MVASILSEGVPELPDLNHLSHAEKDADPGALGAGAEPDGTGCGT